MVLYFRILLKVGLHNIFINITINVILYEMFGGKHKI